MTAPKFHRGDLRHHQPPLRGLSRRKTPSWAESTERLQRLALRITRVTANTAYKERFTEDNNITLLPRGNKKHVNKN